jgi:hypothetical protein
MQLNVARLCLDCEELHEAQRCPVCASETFAFVTRWVPRIQPQSPPRTAAKPIVVPNQWQRIVFGGGAISLIAFGLMRWSRRTREHIEVMSIRKSGELR